MQCRLLSCCSRLALPRLRRSNLGNAGAEHRGYGVGLLILRNVDICTQSDPGSLRGRRFSEASFGLLRARTWRSFLALFLAALWFTLPRLFASRRSAARSTAGLGVSTLASLPPTLHFTGSSTSSGSSARLLLISALAS